MSTASLIAYMRRREAQLADSTVRVTRSSGTGTLDPATATYSAGTTTAIYAGPALVRPAQDNIAQAGETSIDVSGYTVKLPANTAVDVGDLITVTASAHDTSLIGTVLRVLDVTGDEWQVCRRAHAVQETARPA